MYRNIALLLTMLMCTSSVTVVQSNSDVAEPILYYGLFGASGYLMHQLDTLALAKESRNTNTTNQVCPLRWSLSLAASIGLGCLMCKTCDSLCSNKPFAPSVVPFFLFAGSSFYVANESLKTLHKKAANVGAGYHAKRYVNSFEPEDQETSEAARKVMNRGRLFGSL